MARPNSGQERGDENESTAMRVFVDENGAEWVAWEVRPGLPLTAGADRRGVRDRRVSAAPDPVIERRTRDDRRAATRRLARGLGTALVGGWLAFQAGTARRRLAPVPDGWHLLPDSELADLCRRATPAPGGTRIA
jgi:hypothetical protein